jgi:hypothetical protein
MGRKSRDSRRTRVAAEPGPSAPAPDSGRALAAMALAWAMPGAGHLWLGRRQKGLVFLFALPLMFGIGLWLEGALAPFDPTQPLVLLAAFAGLGNGVPYLLAALAGLGEGRVVAATFEYGNTFLIVSGLLNMLICLDAYDAALGRK